MRQFPTLRLARAFLTGALFAFGLGNAVHAGAQERRIVAEEELSQIRPANMFKLSENNEPSVCKPLLLSLNEILAVQALRPYPFMQNKFIVNPWRKQHFYWHNSKRAKQIIWEWEAAYVDLDGDGLSDGLYRSTYMIGGAEYHALRYVHDVADSIRTSDRLDEDLVRNIMRKNEVTFEQFDSSPHHNRQFTELVQINKKTYLLIGRAFYTSNMDHPRFPKVQLLERVSGKFRRVCLFDGQVEIVKHY